MKGIGLRVLVCVTEGVEGNALDWGRGNRNPEGRREKSSHYNTAIRDNLSSYFLFGTHSNGVVPGRKLGRWKELAGVL